MSEETVLTPIAPEEGGMEPPKVKPVPVVSGAAPTVKLKPVIRKPMIRKPVIGGAKPVTLKPAAGTPPPPAAVPEASAADAEKPSVSLKAVTGPIPAQAVLRKTGIVAEGLLTPAQAQAAKTKTSRISLESAIGVAPAMKSAAPMKTIRLRRPTDIPPAPGSAKPAPVPVSAPAPAPAPVAETAAPVATPVETPQAPAEAPTVAGTPAAVENVDTAATTVAKPAPVTVTQKKTLKLQRPGFKRPTVSGLRKPGTAAAPAASSADAPAAAPTAADTVADMTSVADIPDLKPLAPVELEETSGGTVAGVPAWLNVTTLLAAVAALAVMGLCTWTLYCEAAGPNAGPNDMASFHSDTDRRW